MIIDERRLFLCFSTFEEFLVGLSLLTPTAPVDKKTKCACGICGARCVSSSAELVTHLSRVVTFAIYDLESKGRITPENLRFMLSEALKENAVPLSSAQVEKMVADTFKVHDVNRDGWVGCTLAWSHADCVIRTRPSLPG